MAEAAKGAKGKGKTSSSGYGDELQHDQGRHEAFGDLLTAQLCQAINGGATAQAEDLFSRLDIELRRQDSARLQSYVSEQEAAAVAALPDGSDSSGDECKECKTKPS
ncbi:Grm5 [Symbiodinium natans]|uniref:Grm5 protein n=1 Tax=Symbiodinium natans TaxID=878477 RepID=A0A812GWC1_9DINO|nr:Grm5 [Symbiodinium natans]